MRDGTFGACGIAFDERINDIVQMKSSCASICLNSSHSLCFTTMASSPQQYFPCTVYPNVCQVQPGRKALDKHVRGHHAKIVVNPKKRIIRLTLPNDQFEDGDDRMPKIIYDCVQCDNHPEINTREHLKWVHDMSIEDFPGKGKVVRCGSGICDGRVADIETHIRWHKNDILCQQCYARFQQIGDLLEHDDVYHDEAIEEKWALTVVLFDPFCAIFFSLRM